MVKVSANRKIIRIHCMMPRLFLLSLPINYHTPSPVNFFDVICVK